MTCPRCNGTVIRENDPYDGESFVCINCGKRPAITPLGRFYAEQEHPTETYWPSRKNQHRMPPPTRRWE